MIYNFLKYKESLNSIKIKLITQCKIKLLRKYSLENNWCKRNKSQIINLTSSCNKNFKIILISDDSINKNQIQQFLGYKHRNHSKFQNKKRQMMILNHKPQPKQNSHSVLKIAIGLMHSFIKLSNL